MIDLHCHTIASDGSKTPEKLVAKALEIGLTAIAVTDHDTMAGVERAVIAAEGSGLEVVPGIEFSANVGSKEAHLLGYFPSLDDSALQEYLLKQTLEREERGRKMIGRIRDLGYDITYEDASDEADGAPVMSPHIVRALWNKGHLNDLGEASDFYLEHMVQGGDVYIEHSVDALEIIELLKTGGYPIAIAHPHKIRDDAIIAQLIEMGCGGFEAYYPDTDEEVLQHYRDWARRESLFITGGSDYHGRYTSRQLGSAMVPDEILIELKNVRDRLRG